MTVVWVDRAEISDQSEALLDLTQEDQAAITGNGAALEEGFDLRSKLGKPKPSLSTVWNWQGSLGSHFNAMNHSFLLLHSRQPFVPI
jgi:hypothetical protein